MGREARGLWNGWLARNLILLNVVLRCACSTCFFASWLSSLFGPAAVDAVRRSAGALCGLPATPRPPGHPYRQDAAAAGPPLHAYSLVCHVVPNEPAFCLPTHLARHQQVGTWTTFLFCHHPLARTTPPCRFSHTASLGLPPLPSFCGASARSPRWPALLVLPHQAIELQCFAVRGIGKDHAKFSPVATASYRLMPHIEITKPVTGPAAQALVKSCLLGVFDIEDGLPQVSPAPPPSPFPPFP